MGDIERGERNPNAALGKYHELLQELSSYIRMLTTVVGSQSVRTREVLEIRKKLRKGMDQNILYLLWAIFLDARKFFSGEVQPG